MSSTSASASVALESVLVTEELKRRPSRRPDFESENRALAALACALVDSPQTVLQTLADTILQTVRSDSAGISLLTDDGGRFYWPAIAGAWKPQIGSGTPRNFGPCGDVLDRNGSLMFRHPQARYTYFQEVDPQVEEAILVPFHCAGTAVGTVWAVSHSDDCRFDAEDMRLLGSLATFAACAYQATTTLEQMQKATAEAEAANHAKDRFLAVLSHELRTPLTPVIMTVNAMESRDDLPSELRNDVKMIRRNIELECKLIDDLLDLSGITSGKVRLQFDLVDINDLLSHVCAVCRSNVSEKGIQLHCDLRAETNYVVGDAARLHQVFWNLLKNAAKFTPDGGNIYVSSENRAEDEVRVFVRDTGIGIAADALPRIFDAFEQGGADITRQFGGLGLGLAISKLLVERHRGSISAQSAGPDRGSTFVVELPAVSQIDVRTASGEGGFAPYAAEAPGPADRPLRLMVVEDHADTARVLSTLLAQQGHSVRTATTAAAALALADQHTFDIVISDLGLPDMSGYELLTQIKARGDIPCIAMSGFGMEEDRRRSEEAGFKDHLVKPLNLAQLQQSLRRVIAHAAGEVNPMPPQ